MRISRTRVQGTKPTPERGLNIDRIAHGRDPFPPPGEPLPEDGARSSRVGIGHSGNERIFTAVATADFGEWKCRNNSAVSRTMRIGVAPKKGFLKEEI